MHSPIRPSAFAAQNPPPSSTHDRTHLPMIPPVSPIAASPTRKRVAFTDDDGTKAKAPPSVRKPNRTQPAKDTDESSPPHARLDQRPARQKQVVFDKKTASPPRVRNRHFMGNKYKTQGRDHGGRVDNELDGNIFAQVGPFPVYLWRYHAIISTLTISVYVSTADGGTKTQFVAITGLLEDERQRGGSLFATSFDQKFSLELNYRQHSTTRRSLDLKRLLWARLCRRWSGCSAPWCDPAERRCHLLGGRASTGRHLVCG